MQLIFNEWLLTKYVIPYQLTLLAAIDSFRESPQVLKYTSLLNILGLLCVVNRPNTRMTHVVSITFLLIEKHVS